MVGGVVDVCFSLRSSAAGAAHNPQIQAINHHQQSSLSLAALSARERQAIHSSHSEEKNGIAFVFSLLSRINLIAPFKR